MTSTNDGKDVKSNQTSSQKGKTYYIELYKSLEARLSGECAGEERTRHVCEAWRRVHCLCLHSAPSTHLHLLSWLQRHTSHTILQVSLELQALEARLSGECAGEERTRHVCEAWRRVHCLCLHSAPSTHLHLLSWLQRHTSHTILQVSLELQALEARLSGECAGEERTRHVCEAWRRVHCLCLHSAPSTHLHLLSWLQRHTSHTILQVSLELQALEARLSGECAGEERTRHVCEAWRRVHCLCLHSAPSTHPHLLSWLQRHTSHTILQVSLELQALEARLSGECAGEERTRHVCEAWRRVHCLCLHSAPSTHPHLLSWLQRHTSHTILQVSLELQALEARLSGECAGEERTRHVCEAWRRVHCLCLHSAPSTHPHLLSWLQRHTSHTILQVSLELQALEARLSGECAGEERTRHVCMAWRRVHCLCLHSAPSTHPHLLSWLQRHTSHTILQVSLELQALEARLSGECAGEERTRHVCEAWRRVHCLCLHSAPSTHPHLLSWLQRHTSHTILQVSLELQALEARLSGECAGEERTRHVCEAWRRVHCLCLHSAPSTHPHLLSWLQRHTSHTILQVSLELQALEARLSGECAGEERTRHVCEAWRRVHCLCLHSAPSTHLHLLSWLQRHTSHTILQVSLELQALEARLSGECAGEERTRHVCEAWRRVHCLCLHSAPSTHPHLLSWLQRHTSHTILQVSLELQALEARLSGECAGEERTRHVCEAWRRVHCLCLHSAPSTHPHLLSWLQRHTSHTILQVSLELQALEARLSGECAGEERTRHVCEAWRRVHCLCLHSAPSTHPHLLSWLQRHTSHTILQVSLELQALEARLSGECAGEERTRHVCEAWRRVHCLCLHSAPSTHPHLLSWLQRHTSHTILQVSLELQALEARLSGECAGEERTRHVCEAWRRVHCLCLHSAPSTHPHLLSWLQRHTSHTILQTEWQSPKSKEQHTWLADAINAFIAECQDAISKRDGVIQSWESQLLNRGRWFLTVLPNPWGHRVLKALLDSRGPQPSDKEVLEWLKEERGVMFVTRLRQLAASKCDDLALLLATAVMNRVRFTTRLVADVDQAEEPTQDKPEVLTNEPTFHNLLRKEAGFTSDVWELLVDIELVLLYKGESRARCIDLAKQTPLRNGYKLVERLHNRLANSPQEKKLWKNAKEVATLVAQVVIARCMVVPNCVGVARAALYGCVYLLVQLLPAERLPTAAAALAAPAATSRHLHTLAAAVHAQYKEERKPFVCSLYVRAITAGMNELEKLKLETEKASEARGIEQILSSWFIQLGALLSASSRLSCECILTAFSVHPSPTMYERVKRAPPLAPLIMPDIQEQDNETNKEYGSWATDSRTQTNLVKTSETLKLKQTQKQANVLSTAIFAEGEGLGLEADLCQDLAVLLSGPRVKTLYWDLDREVLLENCRTYMERTHGGTRALTTELKYLNLDPNCFQHLPEEEDEDENNIYYGIEKGYEHLVEFEEPVPEDIICDDYFMSDYAETTDTGSCNSEQPIIIPKRKKKKNKQPQMEVEVDPLSLISDTLSVKKERPQSKERSHHKDKVRSKSKVKIDHIKDHGKNNGISDEITKEILKKAKKKERKERKKKEKLDVCDINTTKDEILQSSSNLSKLVDIKIVRSNMSQTERGNLHTKTNNNSCITDSDYDSQGKSSINSEYNENALHEAFTDALFSMDELKSPEKTVTDCSQRTSIPPFSYSPNTVSSVKEDVKKSIQRLIDYRRHKVFTENSISQDSYENQSLNFSISHDFLKSKNLPNNIHSPVTTPKGENFLETHASVKLPAKQHTVVKNESRNICMASNKGNFNSEMEPLNTSFEINKDIQHLPANEKLTKKRQPKILKPKQPQVKNQAVSKLSESQKQYQEFLLQRKYEDTQDHLNSSESTGQLQFQEFLKKQCLQPTELPVPPPRAQDVSTQLPSQQINTNITASQKQFHNFLKELQESINAGATNEVQDFKSLQTNEKNATKKIIQNKKVDNAANTYARLSYMHKNKQFESKLKPANKPVIQNKPLLNVTTEQIQHIKNIDFEKVSYLQATGEIVLAMVDKPKSKLCIAENPKVLVQNIENISSCALNNPVLSNMLSSNKNITVNTEPKKNDKVSKQCNNNTPKVATSLLSEKDQKDIMLLLRQQNIMNPPKMPVKTEFLNNPSGIIINNSAPQCVYSEKQGLDPQNKKISAVEEARSTSCPTSVIKLAHNKSLNNESEKKQNRVKGSKRKVKNESDWKSVMDDILAHKTPTMIGPNALDIVLKKDSFEKRSSESLNSPNNRTVITNCKNQTNITNKDIAKPCTRNTNVTDVKPSTSTGSSLIIKPPNSADLKLKQNKVQSTNKVSPVEILKKDPIHIENKHFPSVIQNSNDPFISGIPNSDYDLLEELMDDDLRQEIGELSSDEETYRNRSTISYLSTSKMKNNLHAKECNLPLNKANVVTIENPFNYCSTTSSGSVKKSNNSNYSIFKKESLKNSLPKTINQKNLGSPKDASLKPQIICNELITSGKVCKKVSGKILETDAPNNKLCVDKVSHKKNALMTTCKSKNQHSNKMSGNICSDPNLSNTVDNAKVLKNNVPQTPKSQNPAQVLLTVPQRNTQAQNVMLIGSTDLIYEPFSTINMNQLMKPGNISDLNRNTYVAVNQAPMNVALLHSTPFVGPVLSPVIIESSVTVPVIQNVPNISMNLSPLNSNKPQPICEGYQNINKNVTTEPILSKTLEVHEKICQSNKDDLKEFLKFKDTTNKSTTVKSDMSTSSQTVVCNTTTENVAQPIVLISNRRIIIPEDTESYNQISTKQRHVENVPSLHLDTKSDSQFREDERTGINTLIGKSLPVDNKTVIMDQEIIKRKRLLISNKLDKIKNSINVKQTALPFASIKSSKHDDKVQSDFRTRRKISDKNIDSCQKQRLPIAKVNRANRSSARLTALRDAPIAIQESKQNCIDESTHNFLEGKCLTTEMNVPNNPKNLCSSKSDNCTKKESLGGHNLGNIEFPTPNNEINHSYKGKIVCKENIEEKIENTYDSKLINNNQLNVEASDIHVKSVRDQTGGVVKKSCQKINKNVCKDNNSSKLTSCESISNENSKEVPIGPRKLNNNCEEVKKGKILKNNSSSNKLVDDSVLPAWVDIEEQIKPVMIKSTIIESGELCKDNISLVCDNTTRDQNAVPLITPATIKSSMKKLVELCNDNISSVGDKNATRGPKATPLISPVTIKNTVKKSDEFSEEYNFSDNTMRNQKAIPLIAPATVKDTIKKSDELNKDNVSLIGSKNTQCDQKSTPPISSETIETTMKKCEDNLSLVGGTNKARDHKTTPLVSPITIQTAIKTSEELSTDNISLVSATYTMCNQEATPLLSPVTIQTTMKKSDELSKDNNSLVDDDFNITRDQKATPLLSPAKVKSTIEISDELCTDNISFIDNTKTTHSQKVSVLKSQTNALKTPDELCKAKNITLVGKNVKLHENKGQYPNSQSISVKDTSTDSNCKLTVRHTPTVTSHVKNIVPEILATKKQDIHTVTRSEQVNNGNSKIISVNTTQPKIIKPRQGSKDVSNNKNSLNLENEPCKPKNFDLSKAKITYDDLPSSYNGPQKRCVRIKLPNGNTFKATISGKSNFNIDSIFDDPTVKSLLWKNINNNTKCTLNIKQVCIHNKKELPILKTEVKNIFYPTSNAAELINLISDDEEDTNPQSFKTEFGNYNIRSMDSSTHLKHQKKFSQKSVVLLEKCNDLLDLVSKVKANEPDKCGQSKPSENPASALQETVTDYIEIDDSSNDSISVISSVTNPTNKNTLCSEKVDELKNLLLKDLGVDVSNGEIQNDMFNKTQGLTQNVGEIKNNNDITIDTRSVINEIKKKIEVSHSSDIQTATLNIINEIHETIKNVDKSINFQTETLNLINENIEEDNMTEVEEDTPVCHVENNSKQFILKLKKCDDLVEKLRIKNQKCFVSLIRCDAWSPEIENKDVCTYNEGLRSEICETTLKRSGSESILNDLDNTNVDLSSASHDAEPSAPLSPSLIDNFEIPLSLPENIDKSLLGLSTKKCDAEWCMTKSVISKYGSLNCSDRISLEIIKKCDKDEDSLTDCDSNLDVSSPVSESFQVPSLVKLVVNLLANDSFVLERLIPADLTSKFIQNRNFSQLKRKANEMEEIRRQNKISKIENNRIDSKYLCRLKHNIEINNTVSHISEKKTVSHCALINEKSNKIDNEMKKSTHPSEVTDNLQDDMQYQKVASLLRIAIRSFQGISAVEKKFEDISNKSKSLLQSSLNDDFCSRITSEFSFDDDLIVSEVKENDHCNDTESLLLIKEMRKKNDCLYNTEMRGLDVRPNIIIGEVPRNEQKNDDIDDSEECNIRKLDNSECNKSSQLIQLTETCPDIQRETDVYDAKAMTTVTKDNTPITTTLGEPNVLKMSTFDSNMSESKPEVIEELPSGHLYLLSTNEAAPDLETNNPLKQTDHCVFKYETKADKDNDSEVKNCLEMITKNYPTNIQQQIKFDITKNDTEFLKSKANSDTQESRKMDFITINSIEPNEPVNSAYSNFSLEEGSSFVEIEVKQSELNTVDQLNVHLESSTNLTQDSRLQDSFNYDPYTHDHKVEVHFEHLESTQTQEMPAVAKQILNFKIEDKSLLSSYLKESEDILLNKSKIKGNDTFIDDIPHLKINSQTLTCERNVVDAEIKKGSSNTCENIHDYRSREWNPFDEVKSLLPITFPESKLHSNGEIIKKDKNSDLVVDSNNLSNSDTLKTIPKLPENNLEIFAQAANCEVIKKDTNPYGFIVTSNEKNSETISPGKKSCKSKEIDVVSDANITEKIISFSTDKSNSEIDTILVEPMPLMQPLLNNSQECVSIGNQSNLAIICPTEETKDRILDIVEDKENNLCFEVDKKSLEPHTKYELQVKVHVDNMSTFCDVDPLISMENAFKNYPVNKSLNICDQNEDERTEKSECVSEKATNNHSRLDENLNGNALSNNLQITTKVNCSDDIVIHKNSTSMTSGVNNINENTEAKKEPNHANKPCSDKDKTIDDIMRCCESKESASHKKIDNYESLEYIDVDDKMNLIKEFSESKNAGKVESSSPNDNKFQNNVTLVYKGDSNVILKGSIYEDPVVGTCYVFPVINRTSVNDEMDCTNVCDDKIINDIESFRTNIYAECNNHDVSEDVQTIENFNVVLPKLTYSRQRLKNNDIISTRDKTNRKRKLSCYDHKFHAKRYRKGKNIDYPKISVATMLDSAYSKEYRRLLDYWTTIKFSYSRPFHKEEVDVPDILNNWPIKEQNINVPDSKDYESILFSEEQFKNKDTFDPLQQTLAEEISQCKEQEYISYDINETNFNMGFGEGSDSVIQISEKRNYISKVSAATLSDVKQSQPFFTSEHYGHCGNNQMLCMSHKHQIEVLKRSLSYIQLRDKVRSFFKKTTAELNYHWLMDTMKTKCKNSYNNSIFLKSGFPYDLLNSDFIEPSPVEATVQVVQVGQLPVSAAAQNPVTCDPRVTQVTDASPQCSIENSPNDDSQSPVKTEYTELTTADLSMPLVQEYDRHMEAQESSKVPNSHHEDIPVETEITSIVKTEITVELSPLKEEPIDYNDSDDLQSLVNKHISNVDYSFDSNDNSVLEPQSNTEISYESLENHETDYLTQEKQQNGSAEKTDQIAHAMNAAGITTTPESMINTRAQALVDMLSQKNCQEGSAASTAPSVNNSYPKTPVNAMTLQQALAQILPPPLNQTNVHENNQTKTNSSVTSQVLHIVQGKNTNGNQITLVDNSQNSVISNSNTPVLHIVQNKGASNSSMTNANPGQHTNSYSGLSLVDAGIQQGNNQLLHIVNTGNQKNNGTGQILKRVNLLTNVTNVQGSNEQKMVQFVCKSADGKSIHLNAPHQRSMVLRLQPIESPSIQQNQKSADCQDNTSPSPTSNTNNNSATNKESPNAQHEIKSRSVYEENYAKFIQNSSSKSVEKSTSLPKFGQAFGKQVFQDGNQKGNDINANNSNLSSINSNSESSECQPNDNSVNLDHIGQINSPPLLLRKSPSQPAHSQAAQANLVQHIKQTIAPMNIQTMHGGVIYTRQIPVNIGGGQTINLITVPSTELIDEAKQKGDVKFVNQNDIDSPIIKIVPQNQSTSNAEASHGDDTIKHSGMPNENAQNTPGQHQPVLTQMRIKLPMLSKTPQMVSGARVVRPSFFQIQRNVIGGANQHVYQQLVLTAAPPLGQHTIRLPQAQTNRQVTKTATDGQSTSEPQMSSSTLEQLREFDMVLEQVKERSTVQPNSINTFTKLLTPTTETNEGTSVTSTVTESTQQVLYSIGSNQSVNVAYINRKTVATTPTPSTFVRSPDSSGVIDSSSASSHAQVPHTVTSESTINDQQQNQPKPAKVGSKKSRPKSSSNPPNSLKINTLPPKPTQKPLEDEQTTQRILYILAEYKEQVENSPDKDKPAPRRRTNAPTNPSGSSKRKKSYSGSRRPGARDMSPVHGEDTCRTLGSEDSSCGTSQGDCNESCIDSHSPEDSPRKVVRKLTFENETSPVAQPRPQPQRNVIVADGQTITVARGTAGKPATAVLMPANYILPVSMVKGGQQIAIVTNRGPKLLTVGGGGERGATNALLLQRLIGPAGLKPVLTRPGVRHVRLPTAALHNLQAFNLATATTVQPPNSKASPAPAPTPPELIETRANSSPWTDRESQDVKPERESSPEGSEPWNLPSSADPHDYTYEETVRTDNMNRTVLEAIPDRYSPDMEAQRIFDKMFDVESKKSYIDSHDDSSRCAYDIDPSDCDDKVYHQVVHKKDGTSQRHHRLTHVSAAALRHKYAILEHELRLQKSLSEECEDLGVDSPSASELFPEAELLFSASPAHDAHHHSHTPQPTILNQSGIPQPDMDDQIATDELLQPDARDERQELDVTTLGLDEGIVTVNEDGHATIQLDQEEFARSHPNTTFHSEPTDEGEVQPFTIAGLKGRHITSTIFHAGRAPATVLVTAPQTTVISQANPDHAIPNNVKYSNMEQIINSSPVTHGNLNLSSVLVKDDRLTKFDNILTDSRELHLSNTASAIVHSTGNATQVIRRVCYEDDKRDTRYLMDEPDAIIAGDDAKMVAEDSSRDATLESIAGDVDDDNSLPGRHAELFWESNSASERSESRRPMDFSSDSEKCCKSPSYDETNSTDSSGVGTHMRLDSVIKDARGIERSGSGDGSSADDTHPPLRTYPAKRMYHALDGEVERSMSGKTRAGERSPDILEVRRRASGRGVVKRGCHCCTGSPAPPRPKKSRQRKPAMDFTN